MFFSSEKNSFIIEEKERIPFMFYFEEFPNMHVMYEVPVGYVISVLFALFFLFHLLYIEEPEKESQKEPEKPPKLLRELIEEFVNKQKTFLLRAQNDNISSLYYSRTTYLKLFNGSQYYMEKLQEVDDDPTEYIYEDIDIEIKRWKARSVILLSPVPTDGNIIMNYNPQILSFEYYADNKISKYEILDAVAMKYVYIFRCLDFYFDSLSEKPSKVLDALKKEIIGDFENINEQKKMPEFIKENAQIFKKIKNPNTTNKKRRLLDEKMDKIKNKFVYVGSIKDYQPIQKDLSKRNLYNLLFNNQFNNVGGDGGDPILIYPNDTKSEDEKKGISPDLNIYRSWKKNWDKRKKTQPEEYNLKKKETDNPINIIFKQMEIL